MQLAGNVRNDSIRARKCAPASIDTVLGLHIHDSKYENPLIQYHHEGEASKVVRCIKGHVYCCPKVLETDELEHLAIDTTMYSHSVE